MKNKNFLVLLKKFAPLRLLSKSYASHVFSTRLSHLGDFFLVALAQTRADTISMLSSPECYFSGFFILSGSQFMKLLSSLSSYDKPWYLGDITVKAIANHALRGDVSQETRDLLIRLNVLFANNNFDTSPVFVLHRCFRAKRHKHLIQEMFAEYLISEILSYNSQSLSKYFSKKQKISHRDLTGSNLVYVTSQLLNNHFFLREYDKL